MTVTEKHLQGEVVYIRCPHVQEDDYRITYALYDHVALCLCPDCVTSLEHAVIMKLMARFAQNIGYSIRG